MQQNEHPSVRGREWPASQLVEADSGSDIEYL